ncbi:hypothetical protein DFP73DRAFT_394469 [Morchella snyderi]|nr:hypothetical protein DFP73DRAFT_394469 [Morchella snyderi]
MIHPLSPVPPRPAHIKSSHVNTLQNEQKGKPTCPRKAHNNNQHAHGARTTGTFGTGHVFRLGPRSQASVPPITDRVSLSLSVARARTKTGENVSSSFSFFLFFGSGCFGERERDAGWNGGGAGRDLGPSEHGGPRTAVVCLDGWVCFCLRGEGRGGEGVGGDGLLVPQYHGGEGGEGREWKGEDGGGKDGGGMKGLRED